MATAVAEGGIMRRPSAKTGIGSWLTTADHKRVGILYGYTAFFFFLIGGLEALLIRAQLARPNGHLLTANQYNELFTMHGLTMIFLVVMPLSAALFNYFVPIMIGARDVAFPRLNAFSYWVFLSGGLFLYSSFIFGGAPNGGWFGYAPLTTLQYSPGHGLTFYALGLQMLGIASIASAANFVTTILNLRAPGMSLMRMPVFVWMTLVTSFLLLFAMPVIAVALFQLTFDRLWHSTFYNAVAGGDPLLWQHLFWLFGHPEVYILILPAMGIVSEILPTFARRKVVAFPLVALAELLVAFIGFGVWGHHMFATGLPVGALIFFAAASMMVVIPSAIQIFAWLFTVNLGRPDFRAPLLFIGGFIALFVIGGLSGIMFAAIPFDQATTDTYFVVAHFHFIIFGAAVFPILGGMYYWFPKVTGRVYH